MEKIFKLFIFLKKFNTKKSTPSTLLEISNLLAPLEQTLCSSTLRVDIKFEGKILIKKLPYNYLQYILYTYWVIWSNKLKSVLTLDMDSP